MAAWILGKLSMKWRTVAIFGGVAAAVLLSGTLYLLTKSPFSLSRLPAEEVKQETPPVSAQLEEQEPVVEVHRIHDFVPRNSTLQDILLRYDVTPRQIAQLVEASRSTYNLNSVKAGNRIAIEKSRDGTFQAFQYDISAEEYLIVEYEGDRWSARRHQYEFDLVTEEIYGSIETSLWNALIPHGESTQMFKALEDVLKWDIDFTTIRVDDSFKLLVEKKYFNEEAFISGRILAFRFDGGGKAFYGFLVTHTDNGKSEYYDAQGRAVKKPFLQVPFRFNPRITSGFSYSRYHPILKRRRPHLALDYGAPRGTRVLASGSGRVVFAGWRGGYGKLVKIRHPNRYVTSYAHLGKIFVRVGKTVSQGHAIGTVGSTGLATGPHLDYRVQNERGRFINPRKLVTLPSKKKIPADRWDHFVKLRDELKIRLDAIPESSSFMRRVARQTPKAGTTG